MTAKQLETFGYKFVFRHRDAIARWFDAYAPDGSRIPGTPFRGFNTAKMAARIHFFAERGIPPENVGTMSPELSKTQEAIIRQATKNGDGAPPAMPVMTSHRYGTPEPVGKHTPRIQRRDTKPTPAAELSLEEAKRVRDAVSLLAIGDAEGAAERGAQVQVNGRIRTVVVTLPES